MFLGRIRLVRCLRKMVRMMRDRLIRLIDQADEECKHTKDCKICSGNGKGSQCMNYHIADDLIANGVVVPPCKIRTKIYKIVLGKIYEYEVASYTVDAEGFSFIHLAYVEGNTIYGVTHSIEEFNKQYYLAREDAERALRKDESK